MDKPEIPPRLTARGADENGHSVDGQGVRSVTRALSLLSAVTHGPKTLTALASESEVSLSTASRLLGTLKSTGYVSQGADGRYIPGPALTAMISCTDPWAGVRALALETTRNLHAQVDETSAFFVRAGNDRLCIESVEANRLVRRVGLKGERAPLYLGAAGKALVAFDNAENGPIGLPSGALGFSTATDEHRSLQQFRAECTHIRQRGFAYSARESTNESWSVAAPVYEQSFFIGVLSVVVPMTRSDEDYVRTLTQATIDIALRHTS